MNFRKGIYTRSLFGVLLAFFFLNSYLGVVTIDMPMNSDGTMSGCSMPGMATLCQMNPLEYIMAWQGMFTAAPNQNDISTIILILLSLAIGVLFIHSNRNHAPPKLSVLSPSFTYFKRYVPIVSPLQEAFSNGILHPKIF